MISNISTRNFVFVRKLEAHACQMGKIRKGDKHYFVNSAAMIVLLFTVGFQA